MKQLSHPDYEKKYHNLTIIVICDRIKSSVNLGSICRISEAFGVSKLFIHRDDEYVLDHPKFIKTSRHAFKNLEICNYEHANTLITQLKSKHFQIVSLEKCDKSLALQRIKFHQKTCLIIGHESTGVNQLFLDDSDDVAHIDMYGNNSSMNVSQATAIGLYECVRQQV